jgi:hypothetical protein
MAMAPAKNANLRLMVSACLNELLFEKGSGSVAGTAQWVLRTTVPDPFSNSVLPGIGAAINLSRAEVKIKAGTGNIAEFEAKGVFCAARPGGVAPALCKAGLQR